MQFIGSSRGTPRLTSYNRLHVIRARALASVSASAVFLPMVAAAQTAPKQGDITQLDAITVTADRVPSRVFDSPATTSVTDAQQIERDSIHTPQDLTREEPGVSVPNQPTRGGAANYVIRGIGENRVRLQIDGVKIPDFPATNFNPGSVYTRDFVDFDAIKQVDIVRGPASALYGSDAIGGVVAFVTKDPADYLRMVNKDWYIAAKGAYDSVDRSFVQTFTTAGRKGPWEALVLYTHRAGKETDINSIRKPNPESYESHNILAKLIYHSPEAGDFKLTGEYLTKSIDTNIRTDLTPTIRDSRGADTTSRPRLSLDWTMPLTWAIADQVKTNVYWTEAQRKEITNQLRATTAAGPINTLRASDFNYTQQIIGGDVQFTVARSFLGWQHDLTYGAVYDFTTTTRPRYRNQINLVTGAATNSVAGETFPNKNFPDTETTQAAFYVQDTAQFGPWRLIPAVRVDYYHLDPKPDALSNNSALGANFITNSLDEVAVSPKFGATYDIDRNVRLVGQYAHGFRAPPYDNANFAFSNPVQGYQIIPNGNLKPETSDSFEGGIRGRFDNGSSFAFTGFYNMYENFIDTQTLSSPPQTPLIVFQYQNLARVRIFGFEAKGEYKLTEDLAAFGSFAYANGENEITKAPINSVDPFTFVTGLKYDRPDGWGGEVRAKLVAAQNRVSDPTILRTRSYATVDTLLHYKYSNSWTVNAGIYNLFDARYFNHADVSGAIASNSNIELFRSPGRSFAINSTIQF